MIENSVTRRQYERIAWRDRIMKVPNGIEWLITQCHLYKFKEELIGPQIPVPEELSISLKE